MLVLDNLSVHRSKKSIERINELGFDYAWVPVYSPELNGIEMVWAMGKQKIKTERLNAIVNGKEIDLKELVLKSFNELNVISIAKCVSRSIAMLNLAN